MAIVSDNTLKQSFQHGDKPDQDNYWNFIDSKWSKNEMIPIEKVQNLLQILNQLGSNTWFTANANFSVLVPAMSTFAGITIISNAALNINIGTTSGGNEIADSMPIKSGGDFIDCIKVCVNETRIYVSGIIVPIQVKLSFK